MSSYRSSVDSLPVLEGSEVFDYWKHSVVTYASSQNLTQYLDQDFDFKPSATKTEDKTAATSVSARQSHDLLLHNILRSLGKPFRHLYRDGMSVHKLFTAIAAYVEGERVVINNSIKNQLEALSFDVKQDSDTDSYINRARELFNKLKPSEQTSEEEKKLVRKVIMKLPGDDNDSGKMILLGKGPETFAQLKAAIVDIAYKVPAASSKTEHALYAGNNHSSRGRGSYSGRGGRHNNNRGGYNNNNNSNYSNSGYHGNEQYNQYGAPFNNQYGNQFPGPQDSSYGRGGSSYRGRGGFAYGMVPQPHFNPYAPPPPPQYSSAPQPQPQQFSLAIQETFIPPDGSYEHALTASAQSSGEWFVDSGCSSHMSGDVRQFAYLIPLEQPAYVKIGNGVQVRCAKYGPVHMPEHNLYLDRVLYVPDLSFNLLSVTQATADGCSVVMTSRKAVINKGGMTILEAMRDSNGLYTLRRSTPHYALLASRTQDAKVWHRRFGHLSYSALSRLSRCGMVVGMPVDANQFEHASREFCDPCVTGKQTREQYPSSDSRSSRVCELVHMDVCCIDVPSLGGNKYFATFYDDFSKFSQVVCCAHKSDVPEIVMEVLTQWETQTGQPVRVIRSDHGGEYENRKLQQWCQSKGIVHQFSVPGASEQNGAAERLNRILLDRARSMLHDMKLPSSLWGFAVDTANYTRNRSPTSHGDKTPHELFVGTKPNVSHMKVFGCRAFVHLDKSKRGKFDSVSVEGIFVGYLPHSKAYRIYVPSRGPRGSIIGSKDVVFDEQHAGAVTAHRQAQTTQQESSQLQYVKVLSVSKAEKVEPEGEPSAPTSTLAGAQAPVLPSTANQSKPSATAQTIFMSANTMFNVDVSSDDEVSSRQEPDRGHGRVVENSNVIDSGQSRRVSGPQTAQQQNQDLEVRGSSKYALRGNPKPVNKWGEPIR